MSSQTTDTLGNQKTTNYALADDLSEADFIKEITSGLVTPPQYFPKNAVLNKMGPSALSQIIEQGVQALSLNDFESYANEENTLVLDTRHQTEFLKGHIPGALYIGLHDNFAPWVGALIENLKVPILFIADEGREEEVVVRLSRVGYDNPLGYLKGGFAAWLKADKPVAQTPELSLADFETNFSAYQNQVVDVRKKSEYDRQHLEGVANEPLDFLPQNVQNFEKDKTYYLHCAGGYRSVIAASILERNGFKAASIAGGFNAMLKLSLPISQEQEVHNML